MEIMIEETWECNDDQNSSESKINMKPFKNSNGIWLEWRKKQK
jgi:hypothetical protein